MTDPQPTPEPEERLSDSLGRKIRRRWRVKFAWYDLWLGAFWDRHQHVLYICPLPCIVIETWKQVEYDLV